ncbi:hypothetical protein D3C71_19930 [compost metagenome]
MRQDMLQVLQEPARTRVRLPYKPMLDIVDGEVVVDRCEAMRRPYMSGWRCKEQRFTLRPIYRFLDSRVGRPWSQVRSELCGTIKGPSAYQLLDRALSQVAENTWLGEDGTVLVNTKYGGTWAAREWSEYFVEPQTGLLRKSHPTVRSSGHGWRQQELERAFARRRDISPNVQAHLVDGIWYRIELKPLTPLQYYSHMSRLGSSSKRTCGTTSIVEPGYVYDCLAGCVSDSSRSTLQALYGRKDVYGVNKRQLNHKELVHLGLAN